jgi:hypothetical protein
MNTTKTDTNIVILLADKNLAKGAIQAANNSTKMTVALNQACELWINDKSIPARDAIENFAEAISHNKDARKKFTQQLSLASKKVRKANGIEKPCGLKVDKDGNLIDAPMRNTGGNGGGEGEGEGSAMTSNTAPSKAQIELTAHLEILREMLAKSKDVAATSALKFAIAKLAASL